MNYIGRRIYYKPLDGKVVYDTGDRSGIDIIKSSIEEDFQYVLELKDYSIDELEYIELDFGMYAEDFRECLYYKVNIETKQLEFVYNENTNIGEKPLVEQIKELKNQLFTADERYQSLNKSAISIEELKQYKILQLKELCSNTIYQGFTSSVNGYIFGFSEHDQANMAQQTLLIVASNGNYTSPIQWKTKNNGVVNLTVDEFNIIINEAASHKLTQQNKYWDLEQQVLLAETLEDVDVIVW